MELAEKNFFLLNLKYSAFKRLQLWIKKCISNLKTYNFLSYLILCIMSGSFGSLLQVINMGIPLSEFSTASQFVFKILCQEIHAGVEISLAWKDIKGQYEWKYSFVFSPQLNKLSDGLNFSKLIQLCKV